MTPRALLPFDKENLKKTIAAFSPTERTLFLAFIGLFIISGIGGLWRLNNTFFLEVPARGGTFVEGIVGTPRFINPLLAVSDADQDLTALIHNGLLKPTPEGTLVTALAESYRVSDDGLSYTFVIREDATFHDGRPVTADDVLFTVERAQDPALKSPRRANWEGVRVEKLSEREVVFTLMEPYGPFLENTVMGILPRHIWKDVGPDEFPFSELNVEPIGTGPYKIKRVERSAAGLPEYYELVPFKNYVLGEPYIQKFIIRFYPSEEELILAHGKGDIDAISRISPHSLARITRNEQEIMRAPLPRIFGVFFNQNTAPLFANKAVRKILEAAVDREKIIQEVLGGYGRLTKGPIPPDILASLPLASAPMSPLKEVKREPADDLATTARTMLEEDGWKQDGEGIWGKTVSGEKLSLTFSMSTSNTPELKAVAELLKKQWGAAGIPVELKFFDTSDLNQNVIRPRRYDALLFGEILGRELDLFSFWHSSQRNDPGLNIALYTNITADRQLETARATSDSAQKVAALKTFSEEVERDVPAVFLYSPDFLYVIPKIVRGIKLGPLTTSAERFITVDKWYIETERLWPWFVHLPKFSFSR